MNKRNHKAEMTKIKKVEIDKFLGLEILVECCALANLSNKDIDR